MQCPSCKKEHDAELSFCPNCGHKTSFVTCSNCNKTLPPGTIFCTHCGKRVSKSSDTFQTKNFSASNAGMIPHIIFAILAFLAAFWLYSTGNDLPFYLSDDKQALSVTAGLVALLGIEECYAAYLSRQVYLTLREHKIDFGYMVSFPFPCIKTDSLAYEDIQSIDIAGTSNLIIHARGNKRSLLIENPRNAKAIIDKQRS